MIDPISFIVAMKLRFGAKAVPVAKEFRFGPERRYVITYYTNASSAVTPPFVERVYFVYRDLDNENHYGKPKQTVIASAVFDLNSTIKDLQRWIVQQVLDFETNN